MGDIRQELIELVWQKNFAAAEQLLKKHPELTRLKSEGVGETALHYLAVENDGEGVAWLHARGFDINTRNHFGTPVVFEVASLGYKDLLLWFIAQGASPEGADYDGSPRGILDHLVEFNKLEMIPFVKEHWLVAVARSGDTIH